MSNAKEKLENIDIHNPYITLYFFQQTAEDALANKKEIVKEMYETPIAIQPPSIIFDEAIIYPAMTGPVAEGRPINSTISVWVWKEHDYWV